MTPRRLPRRHGFTAVELAISFAVAAMITAGAVLAIDAFLARGDGVLADTTIERVVQAQVAHAAGTGTYAYAADASDADLQDKLPEQLVRDVTVTHGPSTGLDVVSVAVSSEQTLVVAVQLAGGTCRWRSVPAVTARGAAQTTDEDATVRCVAAGLLPAGETPAWD